MKTITAFSMTLVFAAMSFAQGTPATQTAPAAKDTSAPAANAAKKTKKKAAKKTKANASTPAGAAASK